MVDAVKMEVMIHTWERGNSVTEEYIGEANMHGVPVLILRTREESKLDSVYLHY